jgi:outer membrane protein OmpA-like peptidoglycan-associated protein/Tol biopolymer transport system component
MHFKNHFCLVQRPQFPWIRKVKNSGQIIHVGGLPKWYLKKNLDMRILAITLLVVLSFPVISTFAQNENPQVENLVSQGDVLYKNKGGKREALDKYRAALDIEPDNVRANYMAGLCYLQTYQKSRSLSFFLKAHDIDPDFVAEVKMPVDLLPDLKFLIARSFQVGENYTKAEEFFNHFKEAVNHGTSSSYSSNNRGLAIRHTDRRIFECLVAQELKRAPVDSRIINVKGINSPYPDYGPVFTPDGKKMFFTSRRAGGASKEIDDDLHFFEDIYIASRDSAGHWGEVKMVKELSTPGHESVSCISEDGRTMIISKGEGNGDLFISQRELLGKWSEPVSLGKNINTSSIEAGAFLAENGKKLYFASDRSGGYGGFDLYLSERRSNGKWGAAVNLGPKINTIFDEDAPSLTKEGDKIYFSSKGHKAMGGFDIFVAKWDAVNKVFKNPENLGFPINSADDDNTYVLSPDSGLAYYASFKENGIGDLDIFHLIKGAPLPDSVKKDQAEFKELAKANVPLMEDKVNKLAEDSSAKEAAEADRVAKAEKAANETQIETQVETSLTESTARENVPSEVIMAATKPIVEPENQNSTNFPPSAAKNNFEVKLIEPTEGNFRPENGMGYFMYDPIKDLAASSNRTKETSVRILIMDTDTRIPLDGNVVFIDQDTKEKITPKRVRNGVFEISLQNRVSKDLMVSVEKEGFHFKNIIINVPPASSQKNIFVTRNIELKQHTINKSRILRNVYFDFDQAELSERSNHELDMLQKMMAENDKLIIEVSGHADFLGEDDYNDQLSKARAEKVVSYLTSKGIDKSRLRAQGYGERKPVKGTDDTEEGRSLNRRTEFMIMAQ